VHHCVLHNVHATTGHVINLATTDVERFLLVGIFWPYLWEVSTHTLIIMLYCALLLYCHIVDVSAILLSIGRVCMISYARPVATSVHSGVLYMQQQLTRSDIGIGLHCLHELVQQCQRKSLLLTLL
jgi:hypothetical protein